ncbi:hypothetical protein [Moorena sp. SIO3H5]|nr:hypothetical protein [Moorena sp. SIO3H5]NEO71079.1 hypothetical protein [Moorena sp. SIO3H5]
MTISVLRRFAYYQVHIVSPLPTSLLRSPCSLFPLICSLLRSPYSLLPTP